jgi:alkanesulfonate monooxygenase SsuD/methylene tetrahydromethanopterin reductase-like flavin-dependent oxidoreductase (luciferase family)
MQIGIGLDQSLRLSFPQQRELITEAVQLGYEAAWTPAGLAQDAFHVCAQWSAAADAAGGGLDTGISVLPVGIWTAPALAATAGTVGVLTGGRFVLGIGTGGIYTPAYRNSFNLPAYPAIAFMRDYLITLHRLLAGETVTYEGTAVTLRGVAIGFKPPRVPVYLGALGPQMLRLAGSHADGAALNWCTPEQIAWSREQIVAGAERAGRDPAEVRVVEYIRVCVDDDADAARGAFTRAVMGYALARPGASKSAGYRGHFARMGFDQALTELEERRERGAPDDDLIEAFPRDLLGQVGYHGPAAGAAAAFRRLAEGLDVAVVRVVPARPGVDPVAAVMRACAPELVRAAAVTA